MSCNECGNPLDSDDECEDCAVVVEAATAEAGDAWRYAASLGYDAATVAELVAAEGLTVEVIEDGDAPTWEVKDGVELVGLGQTLMGASVAALRNRRVL